eukprot:13078119-Ditylum_brightwellii.AAC.1
MAEHVFPKKARQTQKHYMQRNVWLVGEMTVKKWVAWPLNEDKIIYILEYGVPASWRMEFTVWGFDPVDQGLKKIVE